MAEHSLQRNALEEVQQRHANELIISGIAQKAVRHRFDPEGYSDTLTTTDSHETVPVVMFDGSDPEISRMYVYLKQGGNHTGLKGTEVNIGVIVNPGQESEGVIPEPGFTFDETMIVKALVDELLLRKQADLPNLSDDVLAISTQR